MKCLIYARVSPKGSTWASSESTIDMQIQHCKDFVSASGGEVHSIVKDEFFTAKDTRRPGLKGILAELEAGTAEWDSLIVYRLDRLTRSLRDGGEIFDALRENGKGFASVSERLDFSTPVGRAMLWIIHVFAQFEREQLGERTKDKMVQIAREGGYAPGTTPFGYMRKAKHDNALAIDPAKAAIVKDIFESYAAGVQSIEIWKRYSRHISKNQMLAMLRNRVYLGKIVYDGQEYPGKHDSIISEELFGKVQARLPNKARNTRPAAQKHPYLLAGLVKCHCGRRMTPKAAHGKNAMFHYYACTDTLGCKNQVNAEKLDAAVVAKIKTASVSVRDIQSIVSSIKDEREKASLSAAPEIQLVRAAIGKAKAEQDRLSEAFLSGIVTAENKDFFNAKLAEVNKELARLKERKESLESIRTIDLGVFEDAEKLASMLKDLGALASSENVELRRNAILAHVEEVFSKEPCIFGLKLAYRCSSNRPVWLPRQDSNLG